MKQKEFVTADFYLASAISILLNKQPNFNVESGKKLWLDSKFQTVTVAVALAYRKASISAFETYLKEKGFEQTKVDSIYIAGKFLEWHKMEKCRGPPHKLEENRDEIYRKR